MYTRMCNPMAFADQIIILERITLYFRSKTTSKNYGYYKERAVFCGHTHTHTHTWMPTMPSSYSEYMSG